MVDGIDDPAGAQDGSDDRRSSDSPNGRGRARKPVSFDFKLRLTSPDRDDHDGSTPAATTTRDIGVELEPIDLETLTGVRPEEPRHYQTDGDLQSLIVELANQIADPDTSSTPVVRVTASATIEKSRRATPAHATSATATPSAPAVPTVPEHAATSSARVSPEPSLGHRSPAQVAAAAAAALAAAEGTEAPVVVEPVGEEPEPADGRAFEHAGEQVADREAMDVAAPPAPAVVTAGARAVLPSIAAIVPTLATDAPAPTAGPPAPSRPVTIPVLPRPTGMVDQTAIEPAAIEPAVAESVVVEPAAIEPAAVEPAAVEPAAVEPAAVEPAVVEPAAVDPAVVEPAVVEPPVVEPVAAPMPAPAMPEQASTTTDSLAAAAAAAEAAVAAAAARAEIPAAPAPAAAPALAPRTPTMLSNEASMAATAAPAAAAAPAAPLSLARIERKANADRPDKPVDFHSLLGQAGLQPPAKRRKKRHPFRFLFKLIVFLGVVAGGLYAGKVYVLDKRWEPELKPYAEAVSAERGLEWKRAVKIEVLPADEYAARLAATTLGIDDPDEPTLMAEWRAMGLAEGRVTLSTIGTAAMTARPVFYDPTTEMLYELDGVADELREPALDEALTTALLDQHVAWSDRLADGDWSVRTGVAAIVDGDATATTRELLGLSDDDEAELAAERAEFAAEFADDAVGAPAYGVDLVLGPALAGRFEAADADAREEFHDGTVETDAAFVDAKRPLRSGVALEAEPGERRGLVYWYYVLAGRISPAQAWDAAVGWDGDEVRLDRSANGVCITATIATTDEGARVAMRDAINAWLAASPVEAQASLTEIGTDQLQLFSCDPGTDADTVRNDVVPTFGEAPLEHAAIGEVGATGPDAEQCVVNAVRAFDLPSILAAGDIEGYDAAIAGLEEPCVD